MFVLSWFRIGVTYVLISQQVLGSNGCRGADGKVRCGVQYDGRTVYGAVVRSDATVLSARANSIV